MNGHAGSRFPEVERLPLLGQLFQNPHPDQRPIDGEVSSRFRAAIQQVFPRCGSTDFV